MKPIFKIASLLQLMLLFSCNKFEFNRVNKIETDEIAITSNEVVLKGRVLDLADNVVENYGHLWGTDTLSFNRTNLGNGLNQLYSLVKKNQILYQSIIKGLQLNKTYYYKAYLKNTNGEITYGETKSFVLTSKDLLISINTSNVDITSPTSIGVSGKITGFEALNIQQYGHCWGINSEPTILDNYSNIGSDNKDTSFSTAIQNLKIETDYYIRAYAKIDEKTFFYGNQVKVKIPDLKVITGDYLINGSLASLKGSLESLSVTPVIDHGHCWTTSNSQPTINNNKISLGAIKQTGEFNNNINLVSGVTYYYRAYAITGNIVKYGLIKKIVI